MLYSFLIRFLEISFGKKYGQIYFEYCVRKQNYDDILTPTLGIYC